MIIRKITRHSASIAATVALGALTLGGQCASGVAFAENVVEASAISAGQTPVTGETANKETKESLARQKEFAERLLLLEFVEGKNPKENSLQEKIVRLTDEMKRKNYPIQRVENKKDGKELFKQYKVDATPAFVLLLDGKEIGRLDKKVESVADVRDELLRLFQKGRDLIDTKPIAQAKKAPKSRKFLFGFLFNRTSEEKAAFATFRGQAPGEVDEATVNKRLNALSEQIGRTRVENATVRASITDDSGASFSCTGAVLHFNEQYSEALVVVPSTLFASSSDAALASLKVERFADGQVVEKTSGQRVFMDSDLGLALVATRFASPIIPVAFLPQDSQVAVGEFAQFVSRATDAPEISSREITAVDRRRFYQREGETEQRSFCYAQIAVFPNEQALGAGMFVERNKRLFFAGLRYSSDPTKDEGVVIPISVVQQVLLSNRNLSVVYRDQLEGKFDAPASDEEIKQAMKKLKANAPKQSEQQNSETLAAAQTQVPVEQNKLDSAPTPEGKVADSTAKPNVEVAADAKTPSDAAAQTDALAASEDKTSVDDRVASAEKALSDDKTSSNDRMDFTISELNRGNRDDAYQDLRSDRALTQSRKDEDESNKVDDARNALAANQDFTSRADGALDSRSRSELTQRDNPLIDDRSRRDYNDYREGADRDRYASERGSQSRDQRDYERSSASRYEDGGRYEISRESLMIEEENFEAAIETLRRYSLNGAEVVCIVNWPKDSDNRYAGNDTEVVKLPKRTLALEQMERVRKEREREMEIARREQERSRRGDLRDYPIDRSFSSPVPEISRAGDYILK